MTIHDRVACARQRLAEAGIPAAEAALDARLLAQQVLGWDASRYMANAGDEEPAGFAEQYDVLARRRAHRMPFAYLAGHREFWGLSFEVTPAVLIPRPETELIVEAACDMFVDKAAPLRVADVGTGSGCLAVALAREFPAAQVVATDVSAGAIEVARRNAKNHGVDDRIRFLETDLLRGTAGPFDLIVSNPPYVRETDRAALQPEVRDYEPGSALFAGLDGTDIIERLVGQAALLLAAGGVLIFEFGFGQAQRVEELISIASGLTMSGLRADLQGIPRVAVARTASPPQRTQGTQRTKDATG